MNKYKDVPSVQAQLKSLDWRKGCKCKWIVYLNGVVAVGTNPDCRVHDTRWQKFLTALYRALKVRSGS